VIAVVERDVDLRLRAGEQQTLAFRILAHHADRRAAGNAGDDSFHVLPPSCVRIDVRVHVVEPQRVDAAYAVSGSNGPDR
jgi:hypothetical protein